MKLEENDIKKLVYRLGNDMTRNLLLLTAARSGDEEHLPPLYQIATSFRAPRFPLLGKDVLALGYTPGPEIGRILKDIENWWLDEKFKPKRTECLKKLMSEFKPKANDDN